MSFVNSVKSTFNNYADFDGRANRREFWCFTFSYFLISTLLFILIEHLHGIEQIHSIYILITILFIVFQVAIFIPIISLSVRRLHDIGRSGWYILIILIPIVGFITLLIFYLSKSQKGSNVYGQEPIKVN